MKTILGGICLGLSCMIAGVCVDRTVLHPEEDMVPRRTYVQSVDLLPAVHQVDCSKESLREALELLRVCRTQYRMDKIHGK